MKSYFQIMYMLMMMSTWKLFSQKSAEKNKKKKKKKTKKKKKKKKKKEKMKKETKNKIKHVKRHSKTMGLLITVRPFRSTYQTPVLPAPVFPAPVGVCLPTPPVAVGDRRSVRPSPPIHLPAAREVIRRR